MDHPALPFLKRDVPGGRVIIVDYARPRWWHPLRYLFPILLAKLEPFALELWRDEITSWLLDT